MAVIRVKRGTTNPTTSNLSQVGEMGFNTSTNELFIRANSSVVKIGGLEELVYTYTGNASSHTMTHSFSNQFIYRLVVLASTNYKGTDTSQTYFNYQSAGGSNYSGTYLSTYFNDVYSTYTKISSRSITSYYVADSFSSSVSATYAITKTIDMNIYPAFESSTSSTYQWITRGTSITSVSDQSNAPVTFAEFVHSIDGSLGRIFINPGLDLGSTDTIQVSLYRIKRK